MPGCLHKSASLPRQVPSEPEQQSLITIADSLSESLTNTGAIVITLSLVTGASLSLLWGLINALQIVAYLQMLEEAKFPANANEINSVIV